MFQSNQNGRDEKESMDESLINRGNQEEAENKDTSVMKSKG